MYVPVILNRRGHNHSSGNINPIAIHTPDSCALHMAELLFFQKYRERAMQLALQAHFDS